MAAPRDDEAPRPWLSAILDTSWRHAASGCREPHVVEAETGRVAVPIRVATDTARIAPRDATRGAGPT